MPRYDTKHPFSEPPHPGVEAACAYAIQRSVSSPMRKVCGFVGLEARALACTPTKRVLWLEGLGVAPLRPQERQASPGVDGGLLRTRPGCTGRVAIVQRHLHLIANIVALTTYPHQRPPPLFWPTPPWEEANVVAGVVPKTSFSDPEHERMLFRASSMKQR